MNKKIYSAIAVILAIAMVSSLLPVTVTALTAGDGDGGAAEAGYNHFDYDAIYNSKSVWILDDGWVTVNTWHEDGTVYWGDLKNIEGSWIDNAIYNFKVGTGDNLYPSFCANYGSRLLGEDQFQYENRTDLLSDKEVADIVSAFNYINDTWGSLDSWSNPSNGNVTAVENVTKVLAQMAVWMLLDVDVGGIIAKSGHEILNDYLSDVMDAVAAGYAGSGNVIDIVYLANTLYEGDGDHIWCQPQIVPIYRDPSDEPLLGNLMIYKDLGKKASYGGSITGGYADEAVPDAKGKYDHSKYPHNLAKKIGDNGNNWFQYNGAMDFTSQVSYTFDLVQGDKLNKVGEYTITYNGGSSFTITFNDQMAAQGAKFSISNNMQAFKNKNDKGFDDTFIWTTSPGQQQFGFSGASYTFNAPWVKDLTKVNVYLHMDGLSGYENTYGAPAGTTFTVEVKGPSYPNGELFEVPMNGSLTLKDIKAGEYTVRETAGGWIATYYVNGGSAVTDSAKVNVEFEKTAKVRIVNEPDVKVVSMIAFTKMIETANGYAAGEGFKFNVYTEIDNGIHVESSFVTSIVTDIDGIGSFVFEGYDAGTVFYLFEEMTAEQSAVYLFGDQGAYLAVKSVGMGAAVCAGSNVFYNDLAYGGIDVTADIQEKYLVEYHKPVYLTGSSNETLVSWVGYGVNAAELPAGFTGYFLDNGMTYFEIDVAALRALGNGGANIGIAQSNTSGGNTINYRWNSPVNHTYNVKIVDDQVIVTCNLIKGNFGVLLSSVTRTMSSNPVSEVKHNNATVYDLPAGDVIYMFFHLEKGASWYVQPQIVIGCAFDYAEGPFDRPYSGAEDIVMTVTNADGEEVYAGAPGLVEDLLAGEYTVALSVGGNAFEISTASVIGGGITSVDFGTTFVPFYGAPEIVCGFCQ
ncbi:MAG: hypothetical protein FWG41_05500 [Methanomassiliicoccaceae archaeon]|nr:hypothetical protein [Methanomassiliicoccaceae archaeon]